MIFAVCSKRVNRNFGERNERTNDGHDYGKALLLSACTTATKSNEDITETETGDADTEPPPTQTVRVFYMYPSDVAFDSRYPDGIGNVMLDAQAFFLQSLGKTFTLNEPIVESVQGEQLQTWYENTPTSWGEKYWWSVQNMTNELQARFDLGFPDERWLIVGEISAEGDGAGGGASLGWVMLPGHDADGGAGYPENTSRWVGGMVHELGHAFGLPDSTSTDGTCMSASFYEFPNCIFTDSQKQSMFDNMYSSFLQ